MYSILSARIKSANETAYTNMLIDLCLYCLTYEPCCEKTGLQGFRPGPTQTGLYNRRRWQEA